MILDKEAVAKIESQLKRGDLSEFARRLNMTRSSVVLKVNGLSNITESELQILKQVIDDRIEQEQRTIEALNNIIQ